MDNAKGKGGSAPRDRELPIVVYVNPDERAKIYRGARAAGMSNSAYLRSLGVGHQPRAVPDVHLVNSLAELNVEIGRLAQSLVKRVEPSVFSQIETIQSLLARAVKSIKAAVHDR